VELGKQRQEAIKDVLVIQGRAGVESAPGQALRQQPRELDDALVQADAEPWREQLAAPDALDQVWIVQGCFDEPAMVGDVLLRPGPVGRILRRAAQPRGSSSRLDPERRLVRDRHVFGISRRLAQGEHAPHPLACSPLLGPDGRQARGEAPVLQRRHRRREPVASVCRQLVATVEPQDRVVTAIVQSRLDRCLAVFGEKEADTVQRQQRMPQVVEDAPEQHVVERLAV
jgi:hypothetical protein